MLDLEQELAALVDTLNAAGIPYAVCGGLALAIHGAPRATIDIDLFIREEDADAVETLARDLGYVVKALPMTFSAGAVRIRRISKIDRTDGETLMLDLLLCTPQTQLVWETRQTLRWRERDIGVVSREGLIALKKLRGSKQDLADVERLEELE